MNNQKEKIKEALQERVDALKEREARISLLENCLKCQALEGALRAQNVRSPSVVAMKLAQSLKIDEKGAFQIIDENGLSRRVFHPIQAEDGTTHVENVDMSIGELIDEFLAREENAHFRSEESPIDKSKSANTTDYQQKLTEAIHKGGGASEEFLKAWSERHHPKEK